MPNLAPPQMKKTAQRAYYIRVATVWAFLVAAACTIGTIALIPPYVLVSTQLESISSYVRDTNGGRVAYEAAVARLGESQDLAQFIADRMAPPITPLVHAVIQEMGDGVTVSEVRITRDEEGLGPLTVRGSADTREALIAYRDALRGPEYFSEVTLPLGSLVGDSGLTFEITSTVADTYEGSK